MRVWQNSGTSKDMGELDRSEFTGETDTNDQVSDDVVSGRLV